MNKKLRFTLSILIIPVLVLAYESDRDSWQKPDKVMDVLGIKEGMIIGEAGAGRGYFTFSLSRRVGKSGRVYANDISRSALNYISNMCRDNKITNIEIIEGKVDDPLFPDNSLDMAIMVYVYHDLDEPDRFMKNLKRSLKPGANVVILERDPGKWPSAAGHFLYKEKLLKMVREAGYQLVSTETFLPRDNIYIFRPLR